MNQTTALLVLKSQSVAMGLSNGSIVIYNPYKYRECKFLRHVRHRDARRPISCIAEHRDLLISTVDA